MDVYDLNAMVDERLQEVIDLKVCREHLLSQDVKMIIAVDDAPDELVGFVESMKSRFDIRLVEVQRYSVESGEIGFVSELLVGENGNEKVKRPGVNGPGKRSSRSCTIEEFVETYRKETECDEAELEVVRDLYDWIQEHAEVKFGTGNVYGSFGFVIRIGKKPVRIVDIWTRGGIDMKFGVLKANGVDEDFLEEYRRDLGDCLVAESGSDIASPSVRKSFVGKPEQLAKFEKAVLAFVARVQGEKDGDDSYAEG